MDAMDGSDDARTDSTLKKDGEGKNRKADEDLDALLDDALEDFSKLENKRPEKENKAETIKAEKPAEPDMNQEELFNRIFSGLMDPEPSANNQGDVLENMMKQWMNQEAQNTNVNNAGGDAAQGVENALKSALNELSSNAESMKSQMGAGAPEEELMKMLGNFNMDEAMGGEDEAQFMPMMNGMMKSLLSKDILYPSMKEISSKYPAWLETHGSELQPKELQNYKLQLNCMRDICAEFEGESEGENETTKARRFEHILEIMQQMQEYGQPPQEIVGEMAPGLNFDQMGNPKLPTSSDQCSIM